jgi:hypothetical protein
MSLVQHDDEADEDYTFPCFYDTPLVGPQDGSLQVSQWPGTAGEIHQISGPFGREIRLAVEFADGYTTQDALQDVLDLVLAKAFVLHGKLTVGGVSGAQFQQCTFLGYEEVDRFYEGSGVRGWISQGVLKWRQASLSAPPV